MGTRKDEWDGGCVSGADGGVGGVRCGVGVRHDMVLLVRVGIGGM
jgi:hypothetical protein